MTVTESSKGGIEEKKTKKKKVFFFSFHTGQSGVMGFSNPRVRIGCFPFVFKWIDPADGYDKGAEGLVLLDLHSIRILRILLKLLLKWNKVLFF